MSRWKAASIHLGISLFIGTLVASVIYFIWYPPPYFTVSGGSTLAVLIIVVDVVLGPLLTLVIFRAGKRGLAFDLAVIALLQFVAFCYGVGIICRARPIFLVAALDRFVPIYANEVSDKDLAAATFSQFSTRSWTGPLLAGVRMPADLQERADVVFSSFAGKDLEKFPKYYVPYSQLKARILSKSKPLLELAARSESNRIAIERYARSRHVQVDQLIYLPLHGREHEYTMVLAADTTEPLAALAIDPW